jgi:hypothetical protein
VGTFGNASPGDDDGFARVFGLNDDPFSPTVMPAVQDRSLLTELYRRPLRMDRDQALKELFVPDAGPFADYLGRFEKLLRAAGFRRDPVTGKPFAFLVSGEEGTGKSTLVSAFVRALCDGKIHWNRSDYPPSEIAPSKRPPLYDYLANKLQQTAVDERCYLVIDNLDLALQHEAVELYQEYSSTRTLIMFLITKDLELLREAGHNFPVEIRRFRMQPLTPDQAVTFVKRRIERCRINTYAGKLQGYELFPFDADDIHRVVAEKDGQFREGPVTLRVLASTLHQLMEARLMGDSADVELAALSRDELRDQLIFLRDAYRDLMVAA